MRARAPVSDLSLAVLRTTRAITMSLGNAESLAEFYLQRCPWNEIQWTNSGIDTIFAEHAAKSLLLRLSFFGTHVELLNDELKTHQYFPALKSFFTLVQEYFPIRGSILVSLLDGAPGDISASVPILSFAKPIADEHALLIPDPYYLSNIGYRENFETIDSALAQVSRSDRLPRAYWRGSSTGFPTITASDWKNNPRVKLCFFAKQFPQLLDARITRIVQAETDAIRNDKEFQSILTDWEPIANNMIYRFGVDVDGNSCAWGLFQKLYMDLALVKVRSDWMQWYYPLIKEGEHLLSVNPELDNLQELLLGLAADDALACRLANNARELAKGLDYAQAVLYTGTLLSQIFHRRPTEG